jgi:hypothetical protein
VRLYDLTCQGDERFDRDRGELFAAPESDRDGLSLLLLLPDHRQIRDLVLLCTRRRNSLRTE